MPGNVLQPNYRHLYNIIKYIGDEMKKLMLIVASMFIANLAMADCASQAAEKKLAGAAKSSFMQKCERESKGGAHEACEAKASEKKLAGAARANFMKKCEKDEMAAAPAAPAASSCEAKASEKKLAGAAKNSFIKKCEKDTAEKK